MENTTTATEVRKPAVYEQQNQFHANLAQYLSGSLFPRSTRLLWSRVIGPAACRRFAGRVIHEYRQLREAIDSLPPSADCKLEPIPPYGGSNWAVLKLQKYLQGHLQDHLAGALIHGSLATNEEIPYSDLDALVILRESAFNDEATLGSVCFHLMQAQRILWQFDPLQHHGFFVLTECDLDYYCTAYFPLVLYQHAKLITPLEPLNLSVRPRPSEVEEQIAFTRMADAIQEKIQEKRYPRNYFELKLLLSQVMLLPSLYLQHAGTPAFKRESFNLAARDFSEDEWAIMAQISAIRNEWDFQPSLASRVLQHALRTPYVISLYQARIGQRISPRLQEVLDADFYSRILQFTICARQKALAQRGAA